VLRPKVQRDPEYLAWIRRHMCVACWPGIEGSALSAIPMEAAHTGPHGISQKASDHTCIPLCRRHHLELDHQLGRAFWKKYGLNRLKIIAALRKQYAAERTTK